MLYINGNTYVNIDENTGTKIRYTVENEFKPSFAESLDVSITHKCSQSCNHCYMNCTENGKEVDLINDYITKVFIPSLHPYTELALNGNDLDAPHLLEFLELLKKQNVIANITVNQNQFMANWEKLVQLQKTNLIQGIGISYLNPDINFFRAIKLAKNVVIHTIAGITNLSSLKGLDLNLLILGYKTKGRGKDYMRNCASHIIANIEYLKSYIASRNYELDFKGIAFDTLATKQLNIKSILTEDEWERFYQGDDGEFTFYVDLVNNSFAKSSTDEKEYYIDNRNVDEMFDFIKGISKCQKLRKDRKRTTKL